MTEGKAARSAGSKHEIARRFVARRLFLARSYCSEPDDLDLLELNNKTIPIV